MGVKPSQALSMANPPQDGIATRRVAALVADGCDEGALTAIRKALSAKGAQLLTVAPRLGTLKGADGKEVAIDFSLLTTPSVVFDAVFIPGGAASVEALQQNLDAVRFVNEAFRHCKPIAAYGDAVDLLAVTDAADLAAGEAAAAAAMGLLIERKGPAAKLGQNFVAAIAQHRFWSRESSITPPPAQPKSMHCGSRSSCDNEGPNLGGLDVCRSTTPL